jgi:hypothetical protein
MDKLIAAVKAHALANWGTAGWDFVVECWEDSDIAEQISEDMTPEQAIESVGRVAQALDEQRSEMRAMAEW